jgi:AcrR family transcriptional regulator
MRITAEEKAATRKRIVDAAKSLFRTKGFDHATTRDIAREVGIATGTMFNYFDSKEAIVVELATSGFDRARDDFTSNRRANAPIEEQLFALIAAQLRFLRPMRKYIRPLLETALSPASNPKANEAAASLRAELTEHFVGILTNHDVAELPSVTLNIFWALYVGVLTFWSDDKSNKQEDTLALLDQSLRMYADWLCVQKPTEGRTE